MDKLPRSVSPQTIDKSIEAEHKKQGLGFGLSKLFNIFKPSAEDESKQDMQQQPNIHQHKSRSKDVNMNFKPEVPRFETDFDLVDTAPLNNNFSSSKKKRLSVQGHSSSQSDHIPRSSSLANNLGFYQAYYENLKTEKEEESNDLERRYSIAYDNGVMKEIGDSKDFPTNSLSNDIMDGEEQSDLPSRDMSPLLGLIKQNTGFANSNEPVSHQHSTSINPSIIHVSTEEQYHNQLPETFDHEFAPLYRDDEGNLVRPPFINLDPRERYHLIQLKKSIQASESLQRRLKYMVDPQETQSLRKLNNKVETSTQTHDVSYLNKNLKFNEIKSESASTQKNKFRVNKRSKGRKGFFSGEFLYDLKNSQSKKEITKNALDGYLGTVNRPKLKSNIENTKKDSTTTLGFNNDEDKVNRFNINQKKSISKRVGLNESLANGTIPEISLDPDYLKETNKLSNIIRIKESEAVKHSSNSTEKVLIQPSSGFQFQLNEDDVSSIINKHKEDDKLSNDSSSLSSSNAQQQSGMTSGSFLFNKNSEGKQNESLKSSFGDPALIKGAPKFEFGSTINSKNTASDVSQNQTKAKNQLSSDKSDLESKVSTSAADTEVASYKRQRSPDDENLKRKKGSSLFGQGNIDSKGEPNTFPETSSNLFNNASSVSQSSLATKSNDKENLKGLNKDLPKVSFGQSLSEKNYETPQFSFNSSTEKKGESPTFTFGGATKQKGEASMSLPSKSLTEKNEDGSKLAIEQKDISTPLFKLPANNEEELIPKTTSTALFGTGINSSEKSAADNKFNQESKPTGSFSFGGNKLGAEKTPSSNFSFGGQNKETNTATPAFNIGGSSEKLEEAKKSGFSFGSTNDEANLSIAKAPLSFGSITPVNDNRAEATSRDDASSSQGPTSTASKTTSTMPLFGKANSATPLLGSTMNVPSKSTFDFNFGGAKTPISSGAGTGPAVPSAPFSFSASRASTPGSSHQINSNNNHNINTNPNPNAGFSFNNQSNNNTMNSNNISSSNNNISNNITNITAPQPTFGAYGQTQPFQFGQSQNNMAPNLTFGQTKPDPASVFGTYNPAAASTAFTNSRSSTPPVFGSATPGAVPGGPFGGLPPAPQAQAQGQSYTPPVIANRKFAAMRPRRR